MQLRFTSKKLGKTLTQDKELVREYGAECAAKIKRRIMELGAADNLLMLPPAARCHPLEGDRKGQFAEDLKHPYRLVFEPLGDDLPLKEDGSLDIGRITRIIIMDIVDYH